MHWRVGNSQPLWQLTEQLSAVQVGPAVSLDQSPLLGSSGINLVDAVHVGNRLLRDDVTALSKRPT